MNVIRKSDLKVIVKMIYPNLSLQLRKQTEVTYFKTTQLVYYYIYLIKILLNKTSCL